MVLHVDRNVINKGVVTLVIKGGTSWIYFVGKPVSKRALRRRFLIKVSTLTFLGFTQKIRSSAI